jgi:hypothetical protein
LCKLSTHLLLQVLHVYELYFFYIILFFIPLTFYHTLKITLLCIKFCSNLFFNALHAKCVHSIIHSHINCLIIHSQASLTTFLCLLLFVHFFAFAFVKHRQFFPVYFQVIPQAEFIMFNFLSHTLNLLETNLRFTKKIQNSKGPIQLVWLVILKNKKKISLFDEKEGLAMGAFRIFGLFWFINLEDFKFERLPQHDLFLYIICIHNIVWHFHPYIITCFEFGCIISLTFSPFYNHVFNKLITRLYQCINFEIIKSTNLSNDYKNIDF